MAHRYDAVIVGGGHNGLVAATLLARAGRSVLVLERRDHTGGAAVSERPWPGIDARLSRYAYLVSLFPRALAQELGLRITLRRRRVSSYTPHGDRGLLVDTRDASRTRESMAAVGGDAGELDAWQRFHAMTRHVAERVFPTLTEPLPSQGELERLIGDDAAWEALFERPLGEALEAILAADLPRGVAFTDAVIGTFARAHDPLLRQNRCFLYHVVGNGTGDWDIPVGGMGAVTGELARGAREAGAELRTGAEVIAIAADGSRAEVRCADGTTVEARDVLANVAPVVLSRLLDEPPLGDAPEGAQLKVNALLRRLPRLRDDGVEPRAAFEGTFHVNEGYRQLQRAYDQAASGQIPELPPCEIYCHSLTDPTILGPELRDAGAQTLTLFGLHMPARLFRDDPRGAKQAALEATLRSLDSVLAEPIEDCLWRTPDGEPCLEAKTPPEVELELGMPGGHIFHRDLSWPFAEDEADAGRWGVETAVENVWLCGAGARRGGGVSGIPGHNAARAVLEARARAAAARGVSPAHR